MTEEKKEKLKAYVMAASINNPSKTKAWLEHLATLPEEEQEEEIDRIIFERGFSRFEQEAVMFGGIGHLHTSRPLKDVVADASKKTEKILKGC